MQIYKDPKALGENLIYNFGEVYMNLKNFALFLTGNARGNAYVS